MRDTDRFLESELGFLVIIYAEATLTILKFTVANVLLVKVPPSRSNTP